MRINSIFSITKLILILIIFIQSDAKMKYFPEQYKANDLIFPGNEIIGQQQYNLVDAKVLTRHLITLYLKKQGINLDRDNCCEGYTTYDAWTAKNMEPESDLKEIYSHSVYTTGTNKLTYDFPVSTIETDGYLLHHKL